MVRRRAFFSARRPCPVNTCIYCHPLFGPEVGVVITYGDDRDPSSSYFALNLVEPVDLLDGTLSRDRRILRLRYGLGNEPPLSISQIAKQANKNYELISTRIRNISIALGGYRRIRTFNNNVTQKCS